MGQDDEDDALMLQSKQQITFNVVNKRKDQLRRWQNSEMNAEPARRTKRPKVQFQDSDIFLSACMSGDEEEVDELLAKGADINTCTLDGLTALHQSVIDSKPEMVRFLCEKGADVNAQDNEGWTPLHAAACCGNVAIVKYLCQHGADLSIVNSDKELALDLAVDEPCRELLDDDYRRQNIDVDACRDMELNLMMKDAKTWLATGEYRDIPHPRTGGTALHVAAARGYTTLLETLIKAGGNIRAQDKDGWTPLHAAAHWAEKDACKILIDSGAELSDSTFAGQDVLTVADKDVVDYLVELGDIARNREKRKSPANGTPILQEKNHRILHEDHIISTERKRDLQHRDQYSENEFLHTSPSTASATILEIPATTSITLTLNRESSEEAEEEEVEAEEDEGEAEAEEEVIEEEEAEEEAEAEEDEEAESEIEDKSRSVSVSRNSESISNRTSSDRDTSMETSTSAASTATSSSSASSRFASSSATTTTTTTPSSQRSISLPPVAQPISVVADTITTPRSSIESTSGDQTVSATVPVMPTTAPPKAVHQSPSSWINRGFPLASRSSSSSITRSMSTPASEIATSPASSSNVTTTTTPYSATTTPTKVKTSSTSATPSPAGSVTISATFTKPSSGTTPFDVLRSPSQPGLPWSSLWNTNNSHNQIRSQIQHFRHSSSSSLPRMSAFRAPTRTLSGVSMAPMTPTATIGTPSEYPKGFTPQQITPDKMSRWQSKTVNESEAERRNNSRMQRQHRRSTQGVTKEQLEEASRFASDEVSRRNSATVLPGISSSIINHNNNVRLASEEKDLSEDLSLTGDVSTTAILSLSNPVANNVRRKSQGLSLSRSNRRATGPVNPEDLAQLATSQPTTPTSPSTPPVAMSLRLATAASQPYSPASIRSVAGTVPTMTSRFSEKAQSLPPPTNGNSSSLNTPSISSRSAVVAGLSPAPSIRTSTSTTLGASSLVNNASSTTSRYAPSSSLSSVVNPTSSYTLHSRPTETNLNYKALYEKEKSECERLRRENEDLKRSSQTTVDNWRGGVSSAASWRTRNSSPSSQNNVNLSVAKSNSLASFDENERRSMERKITDLELQLKTTQNLRLENQRLKEENGALVRVISKMTI